MESLESQTSKSAKLKVGVKLKEGCCCQVTGPTAEGSLLVNSMAIEGGLGAAPDCEARKENGVGVRVVPSKSSRYQLPELARVFSQWTGATCVEVPLCRCQGNCQCSCCLSDNLSGFCRLFFSALENKDKVQVAHYPNLNFQRRGTRSKRKKEKETGREKKRRDIRYRMDTNRTKAGTRLKEKPKLRKIKHFWGCGLSGLTVGSREISQQNPWTPARVCQDTPSGT